MTDRWTRCLGLWCRYVRGHRYADELDGGACDWCGDTRW